MSRTIEAIMRHMEAPLNHGPHQTNGTEQLEKEVTIQKRQRYIWSEARFVRAMLPFHSNVRIGYNGNEVDGKSVLDLMKLVPAEGSTVRIRIEGSDAAEAMHAVDKLLQPHLDEDC